MNSGKTLWFRDCYFCRATAQKASGQEAKTLPGADFRPTLTPILGQADVSVQPGNMLVGGCRHLSNESKKWSSYDQYTASVSIDATTQHFLCPISKVTTVQPLRFRRRAIAYKSLKGGPVPVIRRSTSFFS